MSVRRLLLAGLLAAAPGSVLAQPAAAPQSAARVPSRAATALAELVAPIDLSVEAELTGARAKFMDIAKTNEDSKALEAEYPGIVVFVFAEIEPLLRDQAVRQWPRDVAEFAQLYEIILTPAEIAVLDAYYRTVTGQRTIRTMFAGVDLTPLLAELTSDPEGGVSAKALASAKEAAHRKVIADTTPADEAAAAALLQGVGLTKLSALGDAIQKLTLEHANAPDRAFNAVLDAATGKAVETYIARQEKKR